MKLATWNVNSIRARQERVLNWLQSNTPDVLCMQEVKVDESEFPFLEFRAIGYYVALYGQKTYNGVAIASREEPKDVLRGLDDGIDDSQARLIAATVSGVRVLSAYVPNGQAVGSDKYQYKLIWLDRLKRYLETRFQPAQQLVIAGDFNVAPEPIDVHDPVFWENQIMFSVEERTALAHLRAFGLVDTFRKLRREPGQYTWWDYRQLNFPKNKGLRIDHVFATPELAERCTSALIDREMRKGTQPSDHAPVIVEFA